MTPNPELVKAQQLARAASDFRAWWDADAYVLADVGAGYRVQRPDGESVARARFLSWHVRGWIARDPETPGRFVLTDDGRSILETER